VPTSTSSQLVESTWAPRGSERVARSIALLRLQIDSPTAVPASAAGPASSSTAASHKGAQWGDLRMGDLSACGIGSSAQLERIGLAPPGPGEVAVSHTFTQHRARKRFGQHWLIDQGVLDQIVAAAELQPSDTVLEIGPGRGALTERLLASAAAAVAAVELDRDLLVGLGQRFGSDPRFTLVAGDALVVTLPEASTVVANIPYNITGPLLERLVGRLDRPVKRPYRRLVLLLQAEVAERLRAAPGSSSFSALSVRMQLLGACRRVCAVPPRCFAPPPKVNSEVVAFDPLPAEQLLAPPLARSVEQLLQRCFAARRKMLRNTLAGLLPAAQLDSLAAAAGIGLQQRPQEVAPAAWVALAAGLNRARQSGEEAAADG
jgi:16S rRNA (adenine1518-N6/adenine1519-N6)-dimethyltransferase